MRRIIHDDQEFSNQSIINVIERFVKSVNLMEETILIPSRLMDRQVSDRIDISRARVFAPAAKIDFDLKHHQMIA